MSRIDIIACGEILIHDSINENAGCGDGSYDFTNIFCNIEDEVKKADLAIANTEVIIGGSELGVSGYPRFNAPYELADAIAGAGFNLMLHSSNHSLDRDGAGIRNCLDYWRSNYPDVKVAGVYDSEEDSREICCFEKDGIRIAILNHTYWTNMIDPPEDMPWCVDVLDVEKFRGDIKRAKENADFVIVCPHWGTEYKKEADCYQRAWSEKMVEWGADLIIGAHPHVMQPNAWIDGVFCVYSLGTFVNWTSATYEDADDVAARMVGSVFKATVERDEADGIVKLISCESLPVVVHIEDKPQGVSVYKLSEYSKELADRNEIKKQDPEFSYDYCVKLAEKVLG